MNLNKFYSDDSAELWEKILGPKLHYHLGSKSNGDIFDQSVINLFPYIEEKSSILDCGCGWGGPARVLIDQLKCTVTGITISEEQVKYINDFFVHLDDLDEYIPDEKEFYDVALFMESFCHLKQPIKLLKNLHNHVKKVIIKDYLWNCEWHNESWGMYMRPKSDYIEILEKSKYEIISIVNDDTTEIVASCRYWFNNFKQVNKKNISCQLKKLYELSSAILDEYSKSGQTKAINTILIVARPV